MGDRLREIGMKGLNVATREDVLWLFYEAHRLRTELASLRDHPGGVDPQTGSEK